MSEDPATRTAHEETSARPRHDRPTDSTAPDGHAPPAPAADGPPAAFRVGDLFVGILLSLLLIVGGTYLVVLGGGLDRYLGFDPYEERHSADMIAGLGILAAVAAYVVAHVFFARAAKERWGMPGMAIGLIIMGSIGLLFLSFCGLLFFEFRNY